MSQNDTNYDDLGIRWESEEVSVQFGDHATDRKIVNPASQIAVMTDVAKFDKAFPGFILAMSNGTSLRVLCQRIGRQEVFHGGKKIEENRQAVLNAIRGVRNKSVTTRRPLPDGTFYHGADEMEYRQLYLVGLVDSGVPAGIAQSLADRIAF